MAGSWGVPYIETSAKTKQNVDKIYYDLMTMIQQQKESVQGPDGKSTKKECTPL